MRADLRVCALQRRSSRSNATRCAVCMTVAISQRMETVAEAKEAARLQPASPLSGARLPVGRPKGTPNKATRTIREAIELACRPGACHPQGLAGWLVARATGGIEDRKIFAGLVGRVMPAQLQASIDAGVVVQLPWLTARNIRPRSCAEDAQIIDPLEKPAELAIANPPASR